MAITPADRATGLSNPGANRESMLIYFAQNPSSSDGSTAIEMGAV